MLWTRYRTTPIANVASEKTLNDLACHCRIPRLIVYAVPIRLTSDEENVPPQFGERAFAQRSFLTNPANSVNVVSHCLLAPRQCSRT